MSISASLDNREHWVILVIYSKIPSILNISFIDTAGFLKLQLEI